MLYHPNNKNHAQHLKNTCLTEDAPIYIRELFAHADHGENKIKVPGKAPNVLARMCAHIQDLANIAQITHEKSSVTPTAPNHVTRLSLDEFGLYTRNVPLTMIEFKCLIRQVYQIAHQLDGNVHLLLSSIPVLWPNGTVHNSVLYVQGGKGTLNNKPLIRYFSKENPSSIDPRYKNVNGIDYPLSADHNVGPLVELYQQGYLYGEHQYRSAFQICTKSGAKTYATIGICLDHANKVGRKNLSQLIALDCQKPKMCPVRVSHVISSSYIPNNMNNMEASIVHVSTKHHVEAVGNLKKQSFNSTVQLELINKFNSNHNSSATKIHFENTAQTLRVLNPKFGTYLSIDAYPPKPVGCLKGSLLNQVFIHTQHVYKGIPHAHFTRLNQQDLNGQTLLHRELRQPNPKIDRIQSLILNGANLSFVDNTGKTPLDLIFSLHDFNLYQVLINSFGGFQNLARMTFNNQTFFEQAIKNLTVDQFLKLKSLNLFPDIRSTPIWEKLACLQLQKNNAHQMTKCLSLRQNYRYSLESLQRLTKQALALGKFHSLAGLILYDPRVVNFIGYDGTTLLLEQIIKKGDCLTLNAIKSIIGPHTLFNTRYSNNTKDFFSFSFEHMSAQQFKQLDAYSLLPPLSQGHTWSKLIKIAIAQDDPQKVSYLFNTQVPLFQSKENQHIWLRQCLVNGKLKIANAIINQHPEYLLDSPMDSTQTNWDIILEKNLLDQFKHTLTNFDLDFSQVLLYYSLLKKTNGYRRSLDFFTQNSVKLERARFEHLITLALNKGKFNEILRLQKIAKTPTLLNSRGDNFLIQAYHQCNDSDFFMALFNHSAFGKFTLDDFKQLIKIAIKENNLKKIDALYTYFSQCLNENLRALFCQGGPNQLHWLHFALKHAQTNTLVHLILKNPSWLHIPDSNGQTFLESLEHNEDAQPLLDKLRKHHPDCLNKDLLLLKECSSVSPRIEVIQGLLDNDSICKRINGTTPFGTLLRNALVSKDTSILKMVETHLKQPLYEIALSINMPHHFRSVLNFGFRPNPSSSNVQTLLQDLIDEKNHLCLSIFLDAYVQGQTFYMHPVYKKQVGNWAHVALEANNIEALKIIVAHNPKLLSERHQGSSLFEKVKQRQMTALAQEWSTKFSKWIKGSPYAYTQGSFPVLPKDGNHALNPVYAHKTYKIQHLNSSPSSKENKKNRIK